MDWLVFGFCCFDYYDYGDCEIMGGYQIILFEVEIWCVW